MRWKELAKHERDLGFVPRDCVRWLDPPELLRSASRVLIARAFADFGDKRELQDVFPDDLAVLGRAPRSRRDGPPRATEAEASEPTLTEAEARKAKLIAPETREPKTSEPGTAEPDTAEPAETQQSETEESGGDKPRDELWIDFIADLGDGFDATFTMASLLAATHLTPGDGPGAGTPLQRAELLVMGGDEVYPTASTRDYENRTTGPYAAALPAPADIKPGDGPSLLALPGNHDWYDGLTSFIRIFTRGRRIGAWQTIQSRSYFAINPIPGWWILGLDSQLSSYIDEPQLDFFRTRVSKELRKGDAVIVCAAEPAWVHTEANPDAFNQLHFFERMIIRNRVDPETGQLVPTGAQVRLWLTGDKHHYCRYEEQTAASGPAATEPGTVPSPAQAITCGLGGAFLSSTHDLPGHLSLPPAESRMKDKDAPVEFALTPTTYPALADSPRLMRRIANPLSEFWAGRRNHRFALTMGVVHLLLVLVLAGVLGRLVGRPGLMGALDRPGPAWALVGAVVVVGVPLVGFAWLRLYQKSSPSSGAPTPRENPTAGLARRKGPPTTLLLVALQVFAAALTLALLASAPLPVPTEWWLRALCTVATSLAIFAVGLLLATEAFALAALWGRTGSAALWSMSGQAIEDHKGFLRMRLTPTEITIHPVVVDEICRDWTVVPARPTGVRPAPKGGLPPVRLLEDPIVITKEARA